MKDPLQSLHVSRMQEEIRLHIQTIDLFSPASTLQSTRKREYIDTYENQIMSLLAALEKITSSFEYAKFITSDEKIYNINLKVK